MRTLSAWLLTLKEKRWHVSLPQALLGANGAYLNYRFRYLLLNHALSTLLHLGEFFLLGFYFSHQAFFALILVRALTLVSKSAWWGALEGLRERVRRYAHLGQRQAITREVTCWLILSGVLAAVFFVLGLGLLARLWLNAGQASMGRFMIYGMAMLLQVVCDLPTRVIHSGMFAVARIYRPWWSIPLPELMGLTMFVLCLPMARAWCLPLSYSVSALTALYLVWHYARRAYQMHGQAMWMKLPWTAFLAWWRKLPRFPIALAGLAGAAMSLEGMLLWLLQPLMYTDPSLFKLLYLISPQISAGFNWARLCYFDLKKLSAPKWGFLRRRFYTYSLLFSTVLGGVFWVFSVGSCWLLLPDVALAPLLWLLPLFMGRSLLAYSQMYRFADNAFVAILLSSAFGLCGLAAVALLRTNLALLVLLGATGGAIVLSWRVSLSRTPILAPVHLTPVYTHLATIMTIQDSMNLLYLELPHDLHASQRLAFLEALSNLVGQGKLSKITEGSLLVVVSDSTILKQVKALALGFVHYFQESGWQSNGQNACNRLYALRKRIFPATDLQLPSVSSELERRFRESFSKSLVVVLNDTFYTTFKARLNDKKACAQWVRALTDGWLCVRTDRRVGQYVALFYQEAGREIVFLAQLSRSTWPLLQQWQASLWQRRLDRLAGVGQS